MFNSLFKIALIGLHLIFAPILHGTQDIVATLSQIPDPDRECLDQFFQCLLRKDSIAYTLYGDKPITVSDYPDPKSCLGNDLRQSLLMEKGWDTWTRYQTLFPSKVFLLKKEETKGVINTNTIVLINKPKTLKAISRNLDLFQKRFGDDFSPNELVRQICATSKPIFDFLGDQALIGILLGFGRTNAVLYSRECEIEDYFQAKLTPPFSCIEETKRLSLKNQQHLKWNRKWELPKKTASPCHAEELDSILNKRQYFELPGDDWFLTFIGSPRFIDYGEDPGLLDSYVKTRRIIRKAYQKGSILEVTLKQWTNPQSLGEGR